MSAHEQPRLPPSPPPSPPAARRRHKKHHQSDPFSDWEKPLPAPDRPSSSNDEPQDPLLTRLILTPILFTSFLLSLFLINRSDRARRAAEHRTPSILTYFRLGAWLNPEPYQDPDNATWERRDSHTHVEPPSILNPENQAAGKQRSKSWHLHKKIRKVAKWQIDDAFDMRGRVIALMIVVVCTFLAGTWMGVNWLLERLWWGER